MPNVVSVSADAQSTPTIMHAHAIKTAVERMLTPNNANISRRRNHAACPGALQSGWAQGFQQNSLPPAAAQRMDWRRKLRRRRSLGCDGMRSGRFVLVLQVGRRLQAAAQHAIDPVEVEIDDR